MLSERIGIPYYQRRNLLGDEDDDDDCEISSDEGPYSDMCSSDDEEELVRESSDTNSFDAPATPTTPLTPTLSPLSLSTKRDYRSRYRTLSPPSPRRPRRANLSPPPSRTASTPTSSRQTSPPVPRYYHPYARSPPPSARRSSWSTGAPSPLPHCDTSRIGRPSARSLSAGLASPPHFHYDAPGHRPRRASLAPSPTYSTSPYWHRHHDRDAPDSHVHASRPSSSVRYVHSFEHYGGPVSPLHNTHHGSSYFPSNALTPAPYRTRHHPGEYSPPTPASHPPPASPPLLSIIIETGSRRTDPNPPPPRTWHPRITDRRASLAAAESSLAAIQPTLRGPMPMKSRPDFTQSEVESYMEHLVVSAAKNTTDVHCNWEGSCKFRVPYATLTDHLRTTHGALTASATRVQCRWGGCGKQVRADSLRKHIVSTHERATRCACRLCGYHMARIEAWNVQRHYESCLPKLWDNPQLPSLMEKEGLRFRGVRGWTVEKVGKKEKAGYVKEEEAKEQVKEEKVKEEVGEEDKDKEMKMIKEEEVCS